MFVILFCTVIILIYYLITRKNDYWLKKNVPHLKPVPLFGNYKEYFLIKKYAPQIAREICQAFPESPYIGTFYGTEPALLIQDLELIKSVMTKDFHYFSGRELSDHSHREYLTQHLFFMKGDSWKVLRQNLTPLFTIVKMKNMFHLIENCTVNFSNLLEYETSLDKTIETKALIARFTTDCVGSCVFGINMNTMDIDVTNNPFTALGGKIMYASTYRSIKIHIREIWPNIFYGLGFKLFPNPIRDFLYKFLTGVFQSRQGKNGSRNDFVDLLLKWKQNQFIEGDKIEDGNLKIALTDSFLVAQCLMLFGAGFDTSATTISVTLFELAKNKEIQEKVIEEVDAYFKNHDGKIEFNCINEMPYLEACLNEALRMYPVLGVLHREVTEDYTFPTGLRIEKGMRVHIPVYHIHYNPIYYPEPETFQPERFFSKDNKRIPFTFLGFGEGPRLCLGMRFGKMQMLAGLLTIFKNHRIELGENMKNHLTMDPRGLISQIKDSIYLKFILRK